MFADNNMKILTRGSSIYDLNVKPQLIKGMVWRLSENTMLLIIYVGVGLCKNMDPISSTGYCIYFESTNGNV